VSRQVQRVGNRHVAPRLPNSATPLTVSAPPVRTTFALQLVCTCGGSQLPTSRVLVMSRVYLRLDLLCAACHIPLAFLNRGPWSILLTPGKRTPGSPSRVRGGIHALLTRLECSQGGGFIQITRLSSLRMKPPSWTEAPVWLQASPQPVIGAVASTAGLTDPRFAASSSLGARTTQGAAASGTGAASCGVL
jgi:hypothetical protein